MDTKMKTQKRRPRRGRMLLVAGAGLASLIGFNTACGIGGVHGVAPCEGADCGPFGTVGVPAADAGPDGGTDAGLDAGADGGGEDAGPDAGGPFGLFPPGDGGSDAG